MNNQILRLAIPNIISNLSVPLLSTVDTALMGRQESAAYIGAVALGSLLFNFIYWSFSFLRMGTTGLTAQAFGKADKPAVSNILGRALITALAGSILILLFYYAQLNFLDCGNNGLWLSFLVFMGARGLVQWVWFRLKIRPERA